MLKGRSPRMLCWRVCTAHCGIVLANSEQLLVFNIGEGGMPDPLCLLVLDLPGHGVSR